MGKFLFVKTCAIILIVFMVVTMEVSRVNMVDMQISQAQKDKITSVIKSNPQKIPDISIAVEKVGELVGYTIKNFTDIKANDWFVTDVAKLVGFGAINGYSDGTFMPEKSITVAEFLKLLLLSVGSGPESEGIPWYDSYVDKARQMGIIDGEESYIYNQGLKRADMAKMLCKYLKLSPVDGRGVFSDTDSDQSKWVNTVFSQYLVRGYFDKGQPVFKPMNIVTRAEACTVIVRMLEYKKDPQQFKAYGAYSFVQQDRKERVFYGLETKKIPAAKDIPVLLYHHILKKDENRLFKNNMAVMSKESFDEQMKLLYDNGFYTITLSEMEKYENGQMNLPQKSVLITFDDGYLSNYTYAYPTLKMYGFNAAIFLIGAGIKDVPQQFNPDRLPFLSWQELNISRDVFDFANHTYDLHYMDKGKSFVVLKPGQEVKQDFEKSREMLKTDYFAYPYGQYSQHTEDILRDLGFKMAFTTKEGRVKPYSNPFEINRYTITENMTMEKFKKIIGLD